MRVQTKRDGLAAPRLDELYERARQLFRRVYGFYPPMCRREYFESHATSYVKWAEVRDRLAGSSGCFAKIHMKPLLRVNIILVEPSIPDEAVISTFIEEWIHIVKGLSKTRPHDDVFWDMALRCDVFVQGFDWKSKNAHTVAQMQHELGKSRRSYLRKVLAGIDFNQ